MKVFKRLYADLIKSFSVYKERIYRFWVNHKIGTLIIGLFTFFSYVFPYDYFMPDSVEKKTEFIRQTVVDINEDLKLQKEESKRQFEVQNKPDIRIVHVESVDNDSKYLIYVKNDGKSTARRVVLNVKIPGPIKGITQVIPELGKNSSQIVPIMVWDSNNENKIFDSIKSAYYNNKAIIIKVGIDYEWDGKRYTSSDYSIVKGYNEGIKFYAFPN
nr:hypothetical protein BACT7_17850 [Tenacibaculum mesophilum]